MQDKKTPQLKSPGWKKWLSDWRLYLMILPALVWLIVFCYVPMYGILTAFQNYKISKGVMGSEFVGLKYFKMWLESNIFETAFGNTLRISFKCLIFGFPIPIIFALMVNRLKAPRFAKAVQTITYIPNFISTVVLVSMMSIFFAPNGLINQIVNYFGIDTTITYSNGKQFDAIFVISGIWQAMGFNSIIYVAALSNIDPTMYEAAKIDGASTWKIITTIDLPTIMPTIVMMLIMNIGNLLSVSHDKILLMQTGTNIMQSEIISTYVNKMGITNVQYSYSTAIGLFNAVINFALLLSANWISKKTTDSGLF